MTTTARPPNQRNRRSPAATAARQPAPEPTCVPVVDPDNRHWLGLGKPTGRGVLAHPAFCVGAAAVAAEALHAADWSLIEAGALGAGVALGTALLPAGGGTSRAVKVFFTTAGLFAGSWLTYAIDTGIYHTGSWVSAGIGVAAGSVAYGHARRSQRRHERRAAAERMAAAERRGTPPMAYPLTTSADPDRVRYEQMATDVGLPGMTFLRREATRCGFSIHMMLPGTGKLKFAQVVAAAPSMEMYFNPEKGGLPKDCVRVEEGRDEIGRVLSRLVIIHFDLRDVLAEILPMPESHDPISICRAFAVGLFADGTVIYLRVREIAYLIAGVRGRGKSNFANIMVYQIGRCFDAIMWVIDLKGGRFAKPWMAPWYAGEVARPVFDWVATTRIEAHRMMVGFLAAIDYRSNAGIGGEEKLEPTREHPALILIVDEMAALVGQHSGPKRRNLGEGPTSADFGGWFTLATQLGRSEAADVIVCTQRTTVTYMGPGNFKSQIEGRIALGVTSPADAASVFPDSPVGAKLLTKLADERTRGAVIVKIGHSRLLAGKSFRLDPATGIINRAARLHGMIRPDLHAGTAEAIDAAVRAINLSAYGYPLDEVCGFHDRWSPTRSAHLWNKNLRPAWRDEDEPDPDPAADPVTAPAGNVAVLAPPATRQATQTRQEATVDPDLVIAAAELVITSQFGSTSMLTRKLRVNAATAEQVMELLQTAGIVAPRTSAAARVVLVPPEQVDQACDRLRTALTQPPPPPQPARGGGAARENPYFPAPKRDTPPIIDTEPSRRADDAVWADLAARVDAGVTDPHTPAPADDRSGAGAADPVEVLIGIVAAAGAAGCTTSELLIELRRRGLIKTETRTQVYRWLDAAGLSDPAGGRIWRPAGREGRYYLRRYAASP